MASRKQYRAILSLGLLLSTAAGSALASPGHKYYMEGARLVREKKYTEALDQLNRCLELEPHCGVCLFQRALAYTRLEQASRARRDCLEALQDKTLPPKYASQCHRILAECFCQEGNFKRAEIEFDQAIQLTPENRKLYMQRADLCKHLNKYEKAIADLTAAIEFRPSDSSGEYWKRARLYAAVGRDKEAIEDFNTTIKQNPRHAEEVYVDLARVHFKIGMTQKAVDDCTAALNHLENSEGARRQDYKALELRARAYDKLGKKDLANADRKRMEKFDDFEI